MYENTMLESSSVRQYLLKRKSLQCWYIDAFIRLFWHGQWANFVKMYLEMCQITRTVMSIVLTYYFWRIISICAASIFGAYWASEIPQVGKLRLEKDWKTQFSQTGKLRVWQCNIALQFSSRTIFQMKRISLTMEYYFLERRLCIYRVFLK